MNLLPALFLDEKKLITKQNVILQEYISLIVTQVVAAAASVLD